MSNTKFIINDARTVITFADSVPVVLDELPNGVYALDIDPKGNLFLNVIEDFGVPSELFGNVGTQAERIVNTFNDRPGTTGILLTGEKGSGKSLLGKLVADNLRTKQDMPVIVVNFPISGDAFGIFLQKIGKPVVVFFDEFEKTYHRPDHQNALLTILDGVYPMKIMAILTSNDESKLVDPLLNRPGRIFYKINYEGLDYKFIMEYAEKKLLNKEHLGKLSRLAALVNLNFDQLQALIQEMNRYNESVDEAVQMLNISTESNTMYGLAFEELVVDGKKLSLDATYKFTFDGELAFAEDDTPVRVFYRAENKEGLTNREWYNNVSEVDQEYLYMEAIGRQRFAAIVNNRDEKDQPMKEIPSFIEFSYTTEAKMDVLPNGNISVTNNKGDRIVVRKPAKIYRKTF